MLDLTGFYDGTASCGGCHSSLPVCLDSDGFRVPEGDGLFSVRLDLPEAQVPLVIRGGAATWSKVTDEPFVLGHWPAARRSPGARGSARCRHLAGHDDARLDQGRALRIRGAGGQGQNRTATAEGEGLTDARAHHLPNRPTIDPVVDAAAATTMATRALTGFNEGDYAAWSADWSDTMKAAIDEPAFLAAREQLMATLGKYVSLSDPQLGSYVPGDLPLDLRGRLRAAAGHVLDLVQGRQPADRGVRFE